MLEIIVANSSYLSQASELFDAYRQFYKQVSNIAAARQFLSERMAQGESMIYLAIDKGSGQAVGFMQIYPSFSSISLKKLLILNDLFVIPEYRKQGVAKALIDTAKKLAKKEGAKGLSLKTAHDNIAGQKLYEACGFKLDTDFLCFFWETT